ncbi:hypothetical protein ACLKA6_004759 [Drosophila palustris]
MDIILPERHSEERFLECASQLQYDQFNAKLFIFYTGSSDVDVYQLMADDRLVQLIYGWDVCRLHSRESFREEVGYIVKILAHHTLHLWFSQEWIGCTESLKQMLLYYLSKATTAFAKIEGLCDVDWQYMLNFQSSPWRLPYLQRIFGNLLQNKHHIIEHSVPLATAEDVTFLMQERLHLIILRLLKLFDAGSWEAVKQLSLRVLAAWLKCNASARCESLEHEQVSITLVGHLYLLTVFVADDNRGYVIDNMMYNIRFYAQSMQESPHEVDYTPARLIAKVCVRLGLGKDGFFESIVFRKFELSLVTPFAVMLKAYTSYVLGNQLLELMALNEHDFMEHIAKFKVLMQSYVKEREDSEQFLLNEMQKLDSQRNSHALPNTVNLNLNYQQQICKGNRASNIGNYKNCDDDEKPLLDVDEELDRQIDPVFQNVPNNEEVLECVYQLLAQRNFRGWQFAKIALLLKIIGQKLNTIEVWRYHPGLTTEFMLNLEHNLSVNYADLAKVFSEHGFMEAEFWLTAFYLYPTRSNYNEVKRCSRFKKKRKDDIEINLNKSAARADKSDQIKYELLSSTIDVDEIVAITNHNAPVTDYDPIGKALQALRLPRSIVNDLLTVAFQPRNKRYSWALDWSTLHERCSALLQSTDLKSKFVALNMAEANDRLKFLKIDYDKYKNRPQLDYGTIEEGYENAAGTAEADMEPSAGEDEEALQQAAREKAEREKKRSRKPRKFWHEVSEDEEDEQESDDSEAYYTGTGRRTRIRAAAVVANAMITDMDRAMRSGRRSPDATPDKERENEKEQEPATETVTAPEPEPENPPPEQPCPQMRSFGEMLESQAKYNNETNGFRAFADIWSFEKDELISVENDNKLLESNTLLSKFRNLQGLKKRTVAMDREGVAAPDEMGLRSPRCSINSDEDSLHSGTSTQAMHDANEFDEGQSGVSKELTPPPLPTSDFTMETAVFQLKKKVLSEEEEKEEVDRQAAETKTEIAAASEVETVKATQVETDTEQVQHLSQPKPETTQLNSEPVEEEQHQEQAQESRCERVEEDSESYVNTAIEDTNHSIEDTDSNPDLTARLVQECLTRQVEVRLDKLTTQDIEKLRGVRVLVKRTDFGEYYREHERRSQNHTEDSNASSVMSESKSEIVKRFVHITSDSPAPQSKRLMTAKPRFKQFKRFKHITSDSSTSTDQEESARPAAVRRRRGPKSGLKTSKTKQVKPVKRERHVTADSDVIELSSDSSSPLPESVPVPMPMSVNRFPEVAMPMELHPLYEEEIVPY